MKLTKLINRLFLSLSLMTLCVFSSNGQYQTVMEPTDITTTANEIESLFSGLMNVTNGDLVVALQQSFLSYSPNAASPPNTEFMGYNSTQLEIYMPAVTGAVGYEVRALHLETGISSSQLYAPSSTYDYIYNTTPGLHMFMVQSISMDAGSTVPTRGAVHVIIVDVDIVLRTINDGPCECEDYANEDWEAFSTGSTLSSNLSTIGVIEGQKFDLFLGQSSAIEEKTKDEIRENEEIAIIHGLLDADGEIVFYNGAACVTNGIELTGVRVFDKYFGTATLLARGEFYLADDMKMYGGKCGKKKKGEPKYKEVAPTQPQVSIINPVQDYLIIQNATQELNTINVYTVNGQQVLTQKVEEMRQAAIPMYGQKAGIYFVELITTQQTTVHKVMKVD